MSTPETFWALVNRGAPDECWDWLGGKDWDGYGLHTWRENGKQRTIKAHRIAYRLDVGALPGDLTLDHLCRNRACCNPAHLDPCTADENKRRGESFTWRARITHCPQGHPYSGENLYVNHGSRVCRMCGRDATRRYRERQKQEIT